eukprot:3762187-Prymnesium_polylepis.1
MIASGLRATWCGRHLLFDVAQEDQQLVDRLALAQLPTRARTHNVSHVNMHMQQHAHATTCACTCNVQHHVTSACCACACTCCWEGDGRTGGRAEGCLQRVSVAAVAHHPPLVEVAPQGWG